MKYLITLLFLSFLISSCEDGTGYTDFCDDLIVIDVDNIQSYVDDILDDLPPFPVQGDLLGHEENPCLTASIDCYACIETFPPQSEIYVSIRDGGIVEERIIDIVTPDNRPMFFVGIHFP